MKKLLSLTYELIILARGALANSWIGTFRSLILCRGGTCWPLTGDCAGTGSTAWSLPFQRILERIQEKQQEQVTPIQQAQECHHPASVFTAELLAVVFRTGIRMNLFFYIHALNTKVTPLNSKEKRPPSNLAVHLHWFRVDEIIDGASSDMRGVDAHFSAVCNSDDKGEKTVWELSGDKTHHDDGKSHSSAVLHVPHPVPVVPAGRTTRSSTRRAKQPNRP